MGVADGALDQLVLYLFFFRGGFFCQQPVNDKNDQADDKQSEQAHDLYHAQQAPISGEHHPGVSVSAFKQGDDNLVLAGIFCFEYFVQAMKGRYVCLDGLQVFLVGQQLCLVQGEDI